MRSYNTGLGWQPWGAWSDFGDDPIGCWFLGASAIYDTATPNEHREEYEMEVALMGSPWAITWINTLTPLAGGASSTAENYLLILPGATYTANFTATADHRIETINPADYMLLLPAP